MAEEERERKSSMRVVDRRRFDMEGNERADTESSDQSGPADLKAGRAGGSNADGSRQASAASQPRQDVFAGPRDGVSFETTNEEASMSEKSENGSEISFSSFVISLATQALMQLGQIKPPEGVEIAVDKVAAKQTIDILTMLESKTSGNLDGEEERLLEEILHNLRIGYVRAAS